MHAAVVPGSASTPHTFGVGKSTDPVDFIQGLPASGLAHLVPKLQVVQAPHILLKV